MNVRIVQEALKGLTGRPALVRVSSTSQDSLLPAGAWAVTVAEPGEPMRAFVVEDDPDVRDSVADVLEMNGWTVQTAEDGIAALGCIHRLTPDLASLTC